MTFPVPSGERRRIFFVLCVLAALGVIAIIFATTGHADVLALPMQSNGWSVCQGGVCQWGSGALPSPNIRHVPQPQTDEEKAAAEKADREWVRECDPKLVRDHLGVKRYQYAKTGCEFGSPE